MLYPIRKTTTEHKSDPLGDSCRQYIYNDLTLHLYYISLYGVVDVKNVGSTAATFAVRNACIQNNKFCNWEHSNSCQKCTQNISTRFIICGKDREIERSHAALVFNPSFFKIQKKINSLIMCDTYIEINIVSFESKSGKNQLNQLCCDESPDRILFLIEFVFTFVSIAMLSGSWKCNLSLLLPSSLDPLNCENL